VPEHPGNPVYGIATHNDPRFPIVTWVVLRKAA
jgi:hypothetical protein